MEILGLDPTLAAILITAIGVSISVLLGWLKGTTPFDVRKVVASAIIAFVVSTQIVIAALSNLPDDIEGAALSAIVFGLIATVSGIDSMTKSAAQAASKARKKK